ncbi:hypothetical protein LTR09_009157 [Extremus antarcticus]|uniref:Uncharacterized protein n=1 Tax=Extremus antarcticus TaxID=702011 RepID=A0AAJ0DG47_9PEZI|nr:hypothetical protein LTR09_009157 [Extremus antarcticus]
MRTRQQLTKQSSLSKRTELFTLMEESPPPVPPKDAKFTPRMELDRPSTAPTSGSKRKREVRVEAYPDNEYSDDAGYADQPTPNKRSKSIRQSDNSASEDAGATQPRNIRRKRGSNNLSNLNLRHAAQQHASQRTLSKESKFQEGSLTDKPSDKPPSIFIRTASSNYRDDDELMEDYHDGRPTPRASVDGMGGPGRRYGTVRHSQLEPELIKKEEAPGFFHFGRSLAANFHPTTLWRKLWNEPKEDVSQHVEEIGHKARQKIEAEARYAEMKKSGQLMLQPVGKFASTAVDGQETPRDSGIEIDGLEHTRGVSRASAFLQPVESESEAPDTTSKTKTIKSRFGHLKKPSLSNIRSDLKRVASDIDLIGTLRNRESSSSLSPVKQDFGTSSLKRSESKFDLRKQQKLSQRVSDLEVKLARARSNLDEALVEASPAPKLTGKYERFTPSATIRRPKFMPGKLPSLPSERILMAEQALANAKEARDEIEGEPKSRRLTLKEVLDEAEEGATDDTIKASRGSKYPRRASSLFNLNDNNTISPEKHSSDINMTNNEANETGQQVKTNPTEPAIVVQQDWQTRFNGLFGRTSTNTEGMPQVSDEMIEPEQEVKMNPTQPTDTGDMDPSTLTNSNGEAAPTEPPKQSYAALDAKLKALDSNVKNARKAAKPKKRKSAAANEDKPFRPGRTYSDDDAEWEDAKPTPKKKRKSGHGSSSPPAKTSNVGDAKGSSPTDKKKSDMIGGGGDFGTSPEGKRKVVKQVVSEDTPMNGTNDNIVAQQEEFSADEGAAADDEQAQPLDVVYEEEEETSKVRLNGDPAKPTATATPARRLRAGPRSRSNSPNKRPFSAEETMLMRAADAVKAHPARNGGGRSVSPPPVNGRVKTVEVDEVVTVKPGANGVPNLPKGANGSFETLPGLEVQEMEKVIVGTKVVTRKKASFEWPEDVF